MVKLEINRNLIQNSHGEKKQQTEVDTCHATLTDNTPNLDATIKKGVTKPLTQRNLSLHNTD